MKLARFFVCSLLLAGLGFGCAHAQSAVDSNSIVNALKPKKAKTRSLSARPETIQSGDQQFIAGLRGKTRGIKFEERKQLTTLVKRYDLPSIDLEIYFAYNSDKIDAKAKPDLVQLGIALRNDGLKQATFLVSGHTDAKGGDDYNLALSERRARSVVDFLTDSFGIEKTRLIAVGYGEEQLKRPDAPEAEENRRVTIVNLTK